MKFGLMFFAASEDSLGSAKYRLIVDSARLADRAGFSTMWVPERHFTGFGGLYPNPAVLQAALAMCTTTIRLNAGSVVAPLHHPLRIAEEWSVVDNLSNGRVGISFASGWNPDDFIFFPERYATRDEHVFQSMQAVRALWRGEPCAGTNGAGQPCSVTIFPRPVQPELPVWMTVAGNPKNFVRAGACGANLLTHLLDQDDTGLESRIALYRSARAAAGFDPATGEVSLMIHTLMGDDAAGIRERARRPYCEYIKANLGLFAGLAQSRGRVADLTSLSPADLDEFVNFLYDRFATTRGLIGTPESCAPLVSRLEAIGVTELACLLDFGPDLESILAGLPHLARLKDLDRNEPMAAVPGRPAMAPFDPAFESPFEPAAVRGRCDSELSGLEFHARLIRHGIQVDGLFEPPATIWRRDGEALAQLTLGDDGRGYHVHPASLDACCRVLAAALPGLDADTEPTCLPAGFHACDVHAPLTGTVWVHAVLAGGPNRRAAHLAAGTFLGDVRVYGQDGRRIATIDGIRLVRFQGRPAPLDTDHLRYERVWREAALSGSSTADVVGRWAVIGGDAEVGRELVDRLHAHGAEVVARPGDPGLRGIVYLSGRHEAVAPDAGAEALEAAVEHTLRPALELLQSCGSTPVFMVTRGALPDLPAIDVTGSDLINLAAAPLWGLGRALAVERPGALGGLIDLDPAMPAGEAAQRLIDVIGGSRGDDMVAFRNGQRLVPRLIRAQPLRQHSTPTTFDDDDTVLVSGGVGGLGLRLSAWLVSRGARHLILCGRNAPSQAGLDEVAGLRSLGVDVIVMPVDVADETDLTRKLTLAARGRPGVTSVFHLAGTLDDGELEGQTWERFAAVLRAKVQGAWNLHRLTRGAPLRHFVMFSSIASLLPAPGQSSYAAANAFLDGLAARRRGEGRPALAVNWGPWSEAGHASTHYGRRAHGRLAAIGVGSISPDEGLHALDTLLQESRGQGIVAAVDWTQLCRADAGAAALGLLTELADRRASAPVDRTRRPSELLDALRDLPFDERPPVLLHYLSDLVIAALQLRTDAPIDPRRRLFDLGVDSILALELKDRLERTVGVRLSATLLFVYPTLEALADYILTELVTELVTGHESASAVTPAPSGESTLSEADLTGMLLREIDVSHGA